MINLPNKKLMNKKIFYIVCVMVFILGLIISTLTLAYFYSRDAVTNKTVASDVVIELLESDWYDHGMTDAKTLEPGMIIDKNPQVLNNSENAVYVRMRIKLIDGNGKELSLDDTRYESIISAIYYEQNDDNGINSAQLVNVAADDILVSQNPYFRFIGNDGWFYYYKDGKFTALDAGDKTPELFNYLKIPILKTEYTGVFDSNFSIETEAQAISVSVDETGKNEKKILDAFKIKYR